MAVAAELINPTPFPQCPLFCSTAESLVQITLLHERWLTNASSARTPECFAACPGVLLTSSSNTIIITCLKSQGALTGTNDQRRIKAIRLIKKPKKPQRRQNNRLKPLTLAYDGDADM
ncbi:hypothetical protein JZ751_009759 [Albula glossodonta]|uniref:Uncharacterized protein n=1 Tax=Albula glossodonta TaxID=121402 RepID=A0A8T2NYJ7_9TELE|nr:hypothetical protein JZ751_009759 [Albula glossodonta]